MSAAQSRQDMKTFITSNWSNTATYCTRTVTIFSCFAFLLSLMLASAGTYSWYQRAFLANAATSALRLRHRILQSGSEFRFSQENLQTIMAEDSLHYLIFSIMFLLVPPVTVAPVPIFCFALLHWLDFTSTLLAIQSGSTMPTPNWITMARSLISQAQSHNTSFFRVIAINEILLMVISIVIAFSGRIIFLPFIYYQFLKLRYASRRNPYSRQAFAELRLSFTQLAASEKCPAFAKTLIHKGIDFISRLSPPVVQTTQ